MYGPIRKISVCTSCGLRAMCISKDGGITWTCNRCGTAFGIGREHIYEQEKTIGNTVNEMTEEMNKNDGETTT